MPIVFLIYYIFYNPLLRRLPFSSSFQLNHHMGIGMMSSIGLLLSQNSMNSFVFLSYKNLQYMIQGMRIRPHKNHHHIPCF